jgi:hypothetical protein
MATVILAETLENPAILCACRSPEDENCCEERADALDKSRRALHWYTGLLLSSHFGVI